MKSRMYSTGIPALILAGALMQSSLAQEKVPNARERIGTYDSRAIAVAFAGSQAFADEFRPLMAGLKRAREAGDAKAAAELEAKGKFRQAKLDRQGFSTAPVDDILAHIINALPEIQKTYGVTAIISKWDETELKKHPGAETVDVTMRLVDALKPGERARKNAIEIQKQMPISLQEAEQLETTSQEDGTAKGAGLLGYQP